MQLVLNFAVLNTVAANQQPGVASVQETIEKVLSKIANAAYPFYMVLDELMQACMPPIWLPILTLRQSALNAVG